MEKENKEKAEKEEKPKKETFESNPAFIEMDECFKYLEKQKCQK